MLSGLFSVFGKNVHSAMRSLSTSGLRSFRVQSEAFHLSIHANLHTTPVSSGRRKQLRGHDDSLFPDLAKKVRNVCQRTYSDLRATWRQMARKSQVRSRLK